MAAARRGPEEGNFTLTVRSWGVASTFPFDQFNGVLHSFNYTGLPEGQTGINFPMEFEWNGEQVDYRALISETGAGLDPEAQRPAAAKAAKIYNDLLPVIPLSMALTNNPLNENLAAGAPADDDPIWLNGGGAADNYITYLVLQRHAHAKAPTPSGCSFAPSSTGWGTQTPPGS